jgi:hypothetical protein
MEWKIFAVIAAAGTILYVLYPPLALGSLMAAAMMLDWRNPD